MDVEEFTESAMLPIWVVCENTFKLFSVGKKPPPEVQLGPQAAAEVARLQAWAVQQVEQDAEPRAAALPAPLAPPAPPPPPPPPPIQVEAVRPTLMPPPSLAALVFDPAVLAQVAAIKARASPVSVVPA